MKVTDQELQDLAKLLNDFYHTPVMIVGKVNFLEVSRDQFLSRFDEICKKYEFNPQETEIDNLTGELRVIKSDRDSNK